MQNEGNVSGSTFFNLSESPPIQPSLEEQIYPGNKVLIFSREIDTQILLKTLLELWGYQTVESDCVEESLSIIEKKKPDLILLDSILPFETHLENIRQIRRNKYSKEIPIIVLSGFSQPHFKILSKAVGADSFLVKPLDFDLLENHLRKNIEKTNQVNTLNRAEIYESCIISDSYKFFGAFRVEQRRNGPLFTHQTE